VPRALSPRRFDFAAILAAVSLTPDHSARIS
jgi:hypothetical protein